MSVATAKWTIEEYHRLVNSGALDQKPVELLQGEIVQMSPEGPLHSNRIRQSSKVLQQQVASEGVVASQICPEVAIATDILLGTHKAGSFAIQN